MSASPQNLLRRNFTVALIGHATIIGALFVGERWMPEFSKGPVENVELIVPADILGDLPTGPGHGKGAYTPPKDPTPPPADTHTGTGAVAPTPPDETPAPPTPTPAPTPHTDEIGIPKPTKKSTPVKPTPTKQNTKPTGKTTPTGSTSSPGPKGPTADQIRQRFLTALRGAGTEGGTPYGDGRPAGGGSGRSKIIGSPDGSPDGVVGGTGPGTPHWQYYLHVHDKMYEAWDQPGSVNDHKLVAVVTIKVARDGNIVGVTLKRSSGNKLMDNSALAAARKVQMLEPPPAALVKGSAAEISVDFQMEG